MTRNQQIMLGRKIKKLITGRIGSSFSGAYQGAGEVAILVIAASSKKFISKIKHFLREELLLDLHVGSKNHGSGEHYTLQIALSDINENSKKIIEERFKMIESKGKKEVVEIPTTEEKKGETPVSHFSDEDARPPEENSSPRPNFIKKINPFLNGIFRFESNFRQVVDPFVFDKEKTTKDYLAISCKSVRIAIEIEIALGWFLRNQSLIARDGKDVLVNHAEAEIDIREKTRAHYCLPPQTSVNIFELVDRLSHVRPGSKPQVKSMDHNHFSVSYIKKNMTEIMFNDLRDMGWAVQKVDGAFLVECVDWVLPFIPEEKIIDPVPSDVVVIPGLTNAEEEALKKLQILVDDKAKFGLLSEATKKEVLDLLRTIEKKKKAEEAEKYAQSLLSVFEIYLY